jgi:hypothetical protein
MLSKVTSTKLKLQNAKLNFHCAIFHRGYMFQATHYSAIKRDVASNRSIFANNLEINRKLQIVTIREGCMPFISLTAYIKYVHKNKLHPHRNGMRIRRRQDKKKRIYENLYRTSFKLHEAFDIVRSTCSGFTTNSTNLSHRKRRVLSGITEAATGMAASVLKNCQCIRSIWSCKTVVLHAKQRRQKALDPTRHRDLIIWHEGLKGPKRWFLRIYFSETSDETWTLAM